MIFSMIRAVTPAITDIGTLTIESELFNLKLISKLKVNVGIRIDKIIYGDSQDDAEYWADLILTLLNEFPQYRNGDHPIFTFNAFAQPSFNFPPYGIIPDKIVMGDGIMQAYTALGYRDVAPQAILAHEFGITFNFN